MLEEALRELIDEVRLLRRQLEAPRVSQPQAPDRLLSLKEAGLLFGVGVSTLKDWIREGKLQRYGMGRVVRVNKAEVLALFAPKMPAESDGVDIEELAAQHLGRAR